MRRTLAWALLVVTFGASTATAQEVCPEPRPRGPIEVTPASGAAGVRLDAPLRVRFTEGYFEGAAAPTPESSLEILDANRDPVAGRFELAGDSVLFFIPNGGWAPDEPYSGTAFGQVDLVFSFRSGTATDTGPPILPPIHDVRSTRVAESCDAPEGGYRVEVTFFVAVDDGAPGSIEYTLYLARGDGAPALVDRVRNISADPSAEATMVFILPTEQVDELACVQVNATDGVGNVTEGPMNCFDPITGPHFTGLCAVTGPERAPGPSAWLFGLTLLVCLWRRRP